jgi:hypothetical protein
VQAVDEFELLPVEAVLLIADFAHRRRTVARSLPARRGPIAVFVQHALAADFAGQHDKLRRRQVSQAMRASGSLDRNRSTIASEIWSATLSGWPSETLSEVKR